jgi:hypothetical protein
MPGRVRGIAKVDLHFAADALRLVKADSGFDQRLMAVLE